MSILLACESSEQEIYYKLFIEGSLTGTVDLLANMESELFKGRKLLLSVGSPKKMEPKIVRAHSLAPELPILFISTEPDYSILSGFYPHVKCLDKDLGPQVILETIKELVGASRKEEECLLRDIFYQVELSLFLKINEAYHDVYIKLSDRKFLKLLKQGQEYLEADIRKYEEKGVTHLYLKKEDFEEFLKQVAKHLSSSRDVPAGTSEFAYQLPLSYQKLVHETILKIGLTESVLSVASFVIASTLKLIDDNPKLSQLWKKNHNPEDYISEHSIILCYITVGLLENSRWHDYDSRIKLCLAALFHDLSIPTSDLGILHEREVQTVAYKTSKDQMLVMNHAFKTVELLSKIDGLPADIDKIISEHHENYEGTGFPKKINFSKLAPLSSFFIIGHEILNALYAREFSNKVILEEAERMTEAYTKGFFGEIVPQVRKLVS